MRYRYIAIGLTAVLMAGIPALNRVSAQQPASGVQPEKGEAKDYDEKVLVTAPYQPSLGTFVKPVFRPETNDSVVRTAPGSYEILSRPLSVVYPVENVKPAKMVGEPIERLRNNSIRIGVGHPQALAELNFGMGRNRKYDFGAGFRHYSDWYNFNDYALYKPADVFKKENKRYPLAFDMSNEANVKGSILSEKFTATLDLNYRQRMVNCYGINDSAYTDYLKRKDFVSETRGDIIGDFEKQARRWYQSARGLLTFKDNARKADDLRFDAYLDYNLNMTNWYSTQSESTLAFGGTLSKQLLDNRKHADVFTLGGSLRFEDNMFRDGVNDGGFVPSLGDDGDAQYNRGNKIKNAWHLEVGPRFHFAYDFVELNGELLFQVYGNGYAKLAGHYEDSAATHFWFTPRVDLKLHIIPNVFTFFIGTDGGVERNTVENISQLNPYLHPFYFNSLQFTVNKISAYVGIASNISKNIDLKVKAEARRIENMLSFDYFRYNYTDGYHGSLDNYYGLNDFVPVYADVWHVRGRADLNLRWDERIRAHVDATYNWYSNTVYYKPAFEANLNFRYNLAANRLSVYTNLYIATPSKCLDRLGEETVLNRNGVYDWSIGAEYRFIKRMTVFLNLNNILCQKYYIWNDYRSLRFNFMAGLTVDF